MPRTDSSKRYSMDQFTAIRRYQPTLAFSPDGSEVAYSTNTSGQFNVWRQPSDGGYPRQLTLYTEKAVRDVSWSPDGETILFGPTPLHLWLYGQDQTDWRIQAVGSDGSDLREIIPGPDVGAPSWTAGGRQFLFTETNERNSAVRMAAPDGSGITDVARFHSRDVVTYPIQQPTTN